MLSASLLEKEGHFEKTVIVDVSTHCALSRCCAPYSHLPARTRRDPRRRQHRAPHPTGTTPLSGEAVIIKGDDSRPFDERIKAIRLPTDDEPDEAATTSEEAAAPVAVAPVAIAPAASPNAANFS